MGEGVGCFAFFSLGGQLGSGLDARLQARYPKYFKSGGSKKLTYLDKDLADNENYWNELLYTVSKGDAGNMRELRKFDIFDFFAYIINYEKDGKRSRMAAGGK